MSFCKKQEAPDRDIRKEKKKKKQEEEEEGIHIKKEKVKLCLFADDMILHVKKPTKFSTKKSKN